MSKQTEPSRRYSSLRRVEQPHGIQISHQDTPSDIATQQESSYFTRGSNDQDLWNVIRLSLNRRVAFGKRHTTSRCDRRGKLIWSGRWFQSRIPMHAWASSQHGKDSQYIEWIVIVCLIGRGYHVPRFSFLASLESLVLTCYLYTCCWCYWSDCCWLCSSSVHVDNADFASWCCCSRYRHCWNARLHRVYFVGVIIIITIIAVASRNNN